MTYLGGRALSAIMADHDRGDQYAVVECIAAGCSISRRIEGSAFLTDQQIISIIADEGWTVRPTHCPEHAQSVDQEVAR